MGYQMVNFKEEGQVAVLELVASIRSEEEWTRLSEEVSACCQRFRANDGDLVLAITERSPALLAMGQGFGTIGLEPAGANSLSRPIAECERPVIIGIRGDCLNLGLEMALACDVRIASERSRFGLCGMEGGLMPWDGGTQRLPRAVGKAKALEMILTGELIDAQEANRIGLVNRIVPTDEVTPTVIKLAKDMASKSPISMECCKEAILKGMDLTLDQGIRLEADLYFLMHTTHDRQEGIKAFKEKREPEFKGN
jgi:enoyl-CoA hydratase/carnithine racemase